MELAKPKKSFSKRAEERIQLAMRRGEDYHSSVEDLLLGWGYAMDESVEEWRQALQRMADQGRDLRDVEDHDLICLSSTSVPGRWCSEIQGTVTHIK